MAEPLRKKKEKATINYEPLSEKHKAFHKAYRDDKIPTRILCGGVGTGKTRSTAADIIRALLTMPEYVGKTALVAGITGTHCRNLLVPEFKKVLSWEDAKGRPRGLIDGRDYTVTMHPMPEIKLSNGSRILFVSLESGVNLRGYNASIVYADDIGESNAETWDALCDRAFRETDGVGYIVATLNPTNKYHWAYKRYFEPLENGTLDTKMVYVSTLTMYDNPALKAKWPITEQLYAHDPVAFRRKVMGEWCSQDGLIYTSYIPKTHVLPRADLYEVIREGTTYTGHDFGGKDATTALWVSKFRDKFYVYREYYSAIASLPISKHAEFINRQTEYVARRYSDHYTESINTYRENGIALTLASKGTGSKLAGIELIQQLFADNRLFISEDCVNLKRELEQYEWAMSSSRDVPKDGNDHCLDALRYVLFEIAGGGNRVFSFSSADVPNSVAPKDLSNIQRQQNIFEKHTEAAQAQGAILIGYEKDGSPIYARAGT